MNTSVMTLRLDASCRIYSVKCIFSKLHLAKLQGNNIRGECLI